MDKVLKYLVRREIGGFSKREFRKAHAYALHKHKNNPHIGESWYLATIIAETICQNRFGLWTEAKMLAGKAGKEEKECKKYKPGFAANALGS